MGKVICLILTCIIIAGCATTASIVQFQYEEPKSSNEVLIYIYRAKHFIGSAVWWPISIDGKDVAHLKQGAYFVIRTTHGEHLIETANRKFITSNGKQQKDAVYFAPGIYFIRLKGMEGEFLSKDQALPEISTMKYDSGMKE